MSNNALIIPQIALPAHIMAQLGDLGGADDLSHGVSSGFPVMSIRGAKWRIVEGGEEKPIYIPGTTDLAPSVRVVLLASNPAVSKTFYKDAFQEGSDAKPDCFSHDGIVPSPESQKPQAATCATCPQNVWGSKISPSGSKIKACADVRRVAILPADDLSYSPILLRIPAASLADLATYGRELKKRGIPYMAVVTKLSFDPAASYPKILFTYERMLEDDEIATVIERSKDPVVQDVLGLNEPRGTVPTTAAPLQGAALQTAVNTALQQNPPAQQMPPVTSQPIVVEPPAQAPVQAEAPKTTRSKKAAGFGAGPAESAQPPAQAPVAPPPAQPSATDANGILAGLEATLAGIKF